MFISKIMDYQNLSDEQFKRRFGVYKQTYRKMVESVKSVEADSNSPSKRGPKPKLSIEEQVWLFVTCYGSIGGHKSTKSLSGKGFN
nr:unnamed protein product [Microcystis aeruginosa PCC 7806]